MTDHALLGTRYDHLARNTIDYWMQPDAPTLSESRLRQAIEHAPRLDDASLRLYLHVPYCAQRCRFCAFSGGNTLDWREAERYAGLLVRQLHTLWGATAMRGAPIRSVNIGGGSPDLLGESIDIVLDAVRALPGFGPQTEIGVELTLATAKPRFIERLVAHAVTKVSFGVQSLDPTVRGYTRQPKTLVHLERVLSMLDGRIPVVNADLITGLPGQTREGVVADLDALMAEPRINAIDPIERIRECPLKLENHSGRLCPLHSRLDAAACSMIERFDGITLYDMLAEDPTIRPLCNTEMTAQVEITLGGSKPNPQ